MNQADEILVLQEQVDIATAQLSDLIDLVWMFVVLVMIFNMQMGFTLLEVGMSRKKHSRSVLLKNLVDVFICSFGFWLIGYSISIEAQGGFLGNTFSFNLEKDKNYYIRWLISFSFCNTSSTIVSGCIAERMHNDTYLAYSLLMVCLIYPVCCSWIWGGGWLTLFDFHDYAGSGVVHLTGGVAGFIQTLMLGPRLGFSRHFENNKFNFGRDQIVNELKSLESMYTAREERVRTLKRL
jgi:Amt family ammonium transporter